MEMRGTGKRIRTGLAFCRLGLVLSALLVLLPGRGDLHAQERERQGYTIRDGRMYISLSKNIGLAALDSFMSRYNLNAIGLFQFIRTRSMDSLKKLGWTIEMDKPKKFVISKPLLSSDNIGNPAGEILLTERHPNLAEMFPAVNNGISYGYNRFRHKSPFAQGSDGSVTIFLRGNTQAGRVMLAGSFNDWAPNALAMTRTDSGWISILHLGPGKYWYKFIVNGGWTIDTDNLLAENDGRGNTNSVFYVTNFHFLLNGFTNARKVFIAGSFNNWVDDQMRMTKGTTGWELSVYLAEGTHTYRYVVDGQWMTDPGKKDRLPNEFGDYNSVIRIGQPYPFRLPGYEQARQVVLTGSFNRWRNDELFMQRSADGWVLPYALGPGNYEYQFLVDGKPVTDPLDPLVTRQDGKVRNSYLIIAPNFTFHLKGYANAASVYLAGDFDDWSPGTLAMKRDGDGWTFTVHLSVGKHLYKYIVDGQWIRDPGNPLWEQNEFDTGNSIVWVEK
jgi:hypothetical protein